MAPTIARRVPAVTFAANAPPLMSPLRPLAAKLQQLVDRIDPQAGRYRMLFESSPLPMWVLDDESMRIVAVDDAPPRLFGCTPEGELQNWAAHPPRPAEARRFLPPPPLRPGYVSGSLPP